MQKITLAKSFKTKGLSKVVVCSLTKDVIDNLVGGAGDDTFIGDLNTVAADQINGGAGNDTVKLYAATALPTMSNIENLELVSGATDLDLSGTGATNITLSQNNAAAEYTIGADQVVTISDTVLSNAAHTVELNHTSTDTATTVILNKVTSAGTSASLEIDGAALATVTISAVGTKSSVDQIVNASAKVTTLNINAGVTLTVVDDLPTGIKTVDASGSTAAVDLSFGTVDLKFTGGAGNDRIDINAITNLTAADTLTGGAGKDTVATSDSGAKFESAEITLIKAELAGFEVLEFTHTLAGSAGNELVIDFEEISVINEVLLSADLTATNAAQAATGAATAGAGEVAVTITGAENTDRIAIGDDENIKGGAGGAAAATAAKASAGADGGDGAIAIKITEDSSQANNSFTIVLDGNNDIFGGAGGISSAGLSGAAASGAVSGDGGHGIAATGVERLVIVSNGDGTSADNNAIAGGAAGAVTGTGAVKGTDGSSVVVNTNGVIVVEGTQALNLGTIGGTNAQVDATNFSGKLTVTGEAGQNIIKGGSAADTIDGGGGADTLSGGAGNDIFVFTTAANSATTAADTITDFQAGDVLRFVSTDGVAGLSATGTTATSNVQVSAGGKVTFAAADDTLAEKLTAIAADTTDVGTDEIAFFEHGGNTYVFNNVGATDDLVVLEGVTGFTTLTESLVTPGDFSFT